MPQTPPNAKNPRGGARPGASRPRLDKVVVKAYLPRTLVQRLEKLAAASGSSKSKIIEDALRRCMHLPNPA
jgi:hypothetical protein